MTFPSSRAATRRQHEAGPVRSHRAGVGLPVLQTSVWGKLAGCLNFAASHQRWSNFSRDVGVSDGLVGDVAQVPPAVLFTDGFCDAMVGGRSVSGAVLLDATTVTFEALGGLIPPQIEKELQADFWRSANGGPGGAPGSCDCKGGVV